MEEARDVSLLCLRLSPRDSRSSISLHHLTVIGYLMREYGAAAEAGWQVLDARPTASLTHRWLAAALGQLGRAEEARSVMRRAEEVVAPLSFADYAREQGPWLEDAQHAHLLEGLRMSGWAG
jgi:hypothetical protein